MTGFGVPTRSGLIPPESFFEQPLKDVFEILQTSLSVRSDQIVFFERSTWRACVSIAAFLSKLKFII